MLTSIKRYFQEHLRLDAAPPGPEEREHRLQLATTALLLEMARVDMTDQQVEEEAIIRAVRERFELPDEEIGEVLDLAREEAASSTDYYEFTSLINKAYTVEQRTDLVEHMWQVAAADGRIDMYQEALVRKLADLLYVPHREFIAGKRRVLRGVSGGS